MIVEANRFRIDDAEYDLFNSINLSSFSELDVKLPINGELCNVYIKLVSKNKTERASSGNWVDLLIRNMCAVIRCMNESNLDSIDLNISVSDIRQPFTLHQLHVDISKVGKQIENKVEVLVFDTVSTVAIDENHELEVHSVKENRVKGRKKASVVSNEQT
jgi:hypothetical protein